MMDPRQLSAYREAMVGLAAGADDAVEQLWKLLQFEAADPVFVREALEDALPALVERYGEVATRLSAEWFVILDPSDGYRAVTAPPAPPEQAARTAAWAAQPLFDGDPDKVLARLGGAVQKLVYAQGRETIMLNAERQGVPFARVARAKACPFCRMLASRGFVYRDEEAAGGVTGEDYHNSCKCLALPKRRGIGDEDVPNLERFRDQYYQARSGIANTSSKEALRTILSRMGAADH